jgi:hypothetical protein
MERTAWGVAGIGKARASVKRGPDVASPDGC